MLIDITLKITPDMMMDAQGNEKKALTGHLGTHFDVMDQEFPLEYVERKAMVFDVSHVADRDIDISDISAENIEKEMFVAFYSGYIEKEVYGSKSYFSKHPQLSNQLIDLLVEKGVSIIGIDFAGVRRGKEHVEKDQYCADNRVFVVENLCNLKSVLQVSNFFIANTYPMSYMNMTGLPCRVVAKL